MTDTPDPQLLTNAIAAVLRGAKGSKDLTYPQISAVTGIPGPKLIRIFKGQSKSFSTDLALICFALGLTLTELFERAEKEL